MCEAVEWVTNWLPTPQAAECSSAHRDAPVLRTETKRLKTTKSSFETKSALRLVRISHFYSTKMDLGILLVTLLPSRPMDGRFHNPLPPWPRISQKRIKMRLAHAWSRLSFQSTRTTPSWRLTSCFLAGYSCVARLPCRNGPAIWHRFASC